MLQHFMKLAVLLPFALCPFIFAQDLTPTEKGEGSAKAGAGAETKAEAGTSESDKEAPQADELIAALRGAERSLKQRIEKETVDAATQKLAAAQQSVAEIRKKVGESLAALENQDVEAARASADQAQHLLGDLEETTRVATGPTKEAMQNAVDTCGRVIDEVAAELGMSGETSHRPNGGQVEGSSGASATANTSAKTSARSDNGESVTVFERDEERSADYAEGSKAIAGSKSESESTVDGSKASARAHSSSSSRAIANDEDAESARTADDGNAESSAGAGDGEDIESEKTAGDEPSPTNVLEKLEQVEETLEVRSRTEKGKERAALKRAQTDVRRYRDLLEDSLERADKGIEEGEMKYVANAESKLEKAKVFLERIEEEADNVTQEENQEVMRDMVHASQVGMLHVETRIDLARQNIEKSEDYDQP